jgi:hypothetical protein
LKTITCSILPERPEPEAAKIDLVVSVELVVSERCALPKSTVSVTEPVSCPRQRWFSANSFEVTLLI